MRGIPILLIAITVIATIRAWPVNLADIEAFDAYLYPIVGFSALLIAIVGLAISTTVPMAYCRYGCPTGALLNFVRRRGTHDRFHRRDVIALGLLATAFFLTSLS
ncbi:MAG: 4Fe-4S binding protein [Verrucomicrobiaceae bacterium]|nr:4Fe-4S binding protein [Verrucomicrobiaceae bacterium]